MRSTVIHAVDRREAGRGGSTYRVLGVESCASRPDAVETSKISKPGQQTDVAKAKTERPVYQNEISIPTSWMIQRKDCDASCWRRKTEAETTYRVWRSETGLGVHCPALTYGVSLLESNAVMLECFDS